MSAGKKYPSRVAEAFRASEAPTLVVRPLQKSTVTATELRCEQPNFGVTASMPREDAYLIALQLRQCHDHDLYFNGKMVQPRNYFAGVTSIYDLRTDPVADLRDPFHCIMFHLPLTSLDAITEELRAPRITELRHEPGVSVKDPVFEHLISALSPAIANADEAHPLFLDHLSLAMMTHIAHKYGGLGLNADVPRGGLAPWQERRAKEMMAANLNRDLPLARLAEVCGLSIRHFSRAFRQSTGVTPHQWLLRYRVDHARMLLRNPALSVSEIALSCGFANQSHFTRVFSSLIGIGPGAWRRENR